jgi:hypothetical protein
MDIALEDAEVDMLDHVAIFIVHVLVKPVKHRCLMRVVKMASSTCSVTKHAIQIA